MEPDNASPVSQNELEHRDKRARLPSTSSQEHNEVDGQSPAPPSIPDGTASRASSSGSLIDHLYPRSGERETADGEQLLTALPEFLEQDHCKVPKQLSNEGVTRFHFPLQRIQDTHKLLEAARKRIGTMDSVSKSFRMISPDDNSLFIQPTDGQPLCFVAPCSASLPKHIQNVLYFFHRLGERIAQYPLNEYVVPTRDIEVHKHRDHPKDIRGLKHVQRPGEWAADEESQEADCTFNLAAALSKCTGGAEREVTVDLPLMTVHVGFTGCVFNAGEETTQELFCVVTVRPVRSFDIAGFIQDVLLRQRKGGMPSDGGVDLSFLIQTWSMILQYEANINCGLEGDPMQQQRNPYGPLGMYTLLNLLSVPLRIHMHIRTRGTDVRILGMPALSYLADEYMRSYAEYMQEYLTHGARTLEELVRSIRTYYSTKEDQQAALEYDIQCPGGWPDRVCRSADDDDEVFKGWSIWRLPLMMEFVFPALSSKGNDYTTFSANMGILPKLAIKKLLDFKQTDWSNPGDFIDDAQVLNGNEKALPYTRTKCYFGEDCDPLKDLMVYGCMLDWYKAVMKDIRIRRESGSITASFAVTLLGRHMRSCMEHHKAMMESGQYNSKHLVQCHEIGKRIPQSPFGAFCLRDYVEELRRKKVDFRIRHDAYLSTCSALFLILSDLNNDFSLNAVNLYVFFEMLISGIVYVVGSHDSTIHTFFGALVICGAQGHMDITDEKGRRCMDNRKPNTTGAGILLVCLNMVADLVGTLMGIGTSVNFLEVISQMRWTLVSMESQCCYTVVGNQITSKPPDDLQDRPQVSLEGRGDTKSRDSSLITVGMPRDDGKKRTQVSTTTVDMNKDNNRGLQKKYQDTYPVLSGLATNCAPDDPDPPQTIAAVAHVVASGAPPYRRLTDVDNRPPNDMQCDVNSKRVKLPDDEPRKTILAGFFALMYFAKADVAVLHRSGMLPAQVTPQSAATLDWLFMYIKEHVISLFDERVAQSYSRMTQGYETRHVAGALWVHTIMAFMASEKDTVKAALDASMAFALNPIPVSEAPAVAHSLLSRGLSVGLFSVTSCLIQALKVPVIPTEHLRCFFSVEAEPASHDYQVSKRAIKEWVALCCRERCFCPADSDEPWCRLTNLCPYLTSPGTESGMVNHGSEWLQLMRVNTDRSQRPVHEKVAAKFQTCFGEELFRYCGIGKELSVSRLLMEKIMHMPPVDLRPLLGGVPIYDTGKHLVRLGLNDELPALCLDSRSKPDNYFKTFAWKTVGHEVVAESVGVNMWALLLLASLLGTDEIHVNNTRRVAAEILALVLHLAPPGVTPGNRCIVRCFDDRTLNAVSVVVPSEDRPEHFLRPLRDDSFATTGKYGYCPQVGKFLPEDALHMVHLEAMATRFLFCPSSDVPPEALRGDYQVIPQRHYSIVRKGSEAHPAAAGTLCVDAKECVLRYEEEEGLGYRVRLNVMEWSSQLGGLGFVMTPMVFRSGALVSVRHPTARVGCLVPSGTLESVLDAGLDPCRRGLYVGNFDFIRMGYHALVEPETTVFLNTDVVLDKLIVPGTVLWIKPGTPTWLGFKDQGLFPMRQRGDDDYDVCALRVRLNVPTVLHPTPGKVFVTVMERKRGNSHKASCLYRVIQVDPWELDNDGDGYSEISHLVDVKKKIISETSQCVVATVILFATVAVSVVCFYYYPNALLVLVPLGMILSCKLPYWQIPTYLCIILLIFHLLMCLYQHTHVVVF